MANPPLAYPEQTTRSRDDLDGELPTQPSALPSSSVGQPYAEMAATAEPIPANERPAASPLPDGRRARNKRNLWSLALLLAVLGGIGVVAASRNDDSAVRRQGETTVPLNP